MEKLNFRQIHLDFHTSEYIEDIGLNFDSKKFAKTLEKAYVNSVTCFARCHHGWLYYPSKNNSEMIHPNLKNQNLLIEQIDECHKLDIKVPIYTTVQWDGYISEKYPDWLSRDIDDNPICTQNVAKPHFYNTICLNSPYREYFKNHLMDIIESIGFEKIDGFFMDILFGIDCNCRYCREKMEALNIDASVKEERIAYSNIMLNEFRTEITELINSKTKEATIFYNSSHIGPRFWDSLDAFTHLELESLPSGGWGYDHFPTTVRFARLLGKEILGMTGKFHTYWGDFHSLKNQVALEFECFNMLAQGCKCSIGDQLHPNGVLSKGSYDLIGKVYKSVKEKEKYLKNIEVISEIGLLTPEGFNKEKGTSQALIGAVRMLQELSYQFDIIDGNIDFNRYKLIIIPDVIKGDQNLKDKLEAYVEKGGKVIGTYDSLDLNEKIDFFNNKRLGKSKYDRDFIMPNNIIGKKLPKEEFVMYLGKIDIDCEKNYVLLDSVNPYFNRGENNQFCSHQHSPSSKKIGNPAATIYENRIYFAHPIFSIYRKNAAKWCKEIINDAIELLMTSQLVSHNGPSTILTTLQKDLDTNGYVLHILHYITEKRSQDIYTIEDIIPLFNTEITIEIDDYDIKSIRKYQDDQNINFIKVGNKIKFKIDKINGHEMIIIK
ncbi:MAG: beta-galactosidase trimerization domain-containing protein [Peptostreptococcaceae bacterium]